MSVYTFEKSFLQRLEDFKLILDEACYHEIRENWREFLETSIEPAGYSAIWKMSRASCEELKLNYPCDVLGQTLDTNFEDFRATFQILSVQSDSVHLPETCEVPLEDLYPTIEQENSALNVDITADCLDRYRFFFSYIFMPWDQSKGFEETLLMPRMKLFFDLKNKIIKKGLSSHIRSIIAEAKYIENKRENLELSIEDDDKDIDISCGESKVKAKELLKLHLRLRKIKDEMDILVNPDMREIYEELRFPHHQLDERKIFVVTKSATLNEQLQTIQQLKGKVQHDQKIHWLSLQDAIAASGASSEIYIPSGAHSFSFLEYLNGNLLLSGLPKVSLDDFDLDRCALVNSPDSAAMLFIIDGDLKVENLVIDCVNVKTGFMVKSGKLTVKNCVIRGSKDSSVTEAFNASGDSQVLIENCVIYDFATGISISDAAKVNLRNSTIKNCNLGVFLSDEESMVSMENSSLLNCDDNGILKNSSKLSESKSLDWNQKDEAGSFHIHFIGDSNKFDGIKTGNDVVIAPRIFTTVNFSPSENSLDVSMEQ